MDKRGLISGIELCIFFQPQLVLISYNVFENLLNGSYVPRYNFLFCFLFSTLVFFVVGCEGYEGKATIMLRDTGPTTITPT